MGYMHTWAAIRVLYMARILIFYINYVIHFWERVDLETHRQKCIGVRVFVYFCVRPCLHDYKSTKY